MPWAQSGMTDCPANLDSIHDIKRAIDQGHRDCGAFVVIDPHRSQPKLPTFRIDSSLLISGTSRHSKPKRTAKLTSDYISRRRDAVDGYVGLVGLTECCGGQQNSKRQDFHVYDSNNLLDPINDPFAVVLLVSYRCWYPSKGEGSDCADSVATHVAWNRRACFCV